MLLTSSTDYSITGNCLLLYRIIWPLCTAPPAPWNELKRAVLGLVHDSFLPLVWVVLLTCGAY